MRIDFAHTLRPMRLLKSLPCVIPFNKRIVHVVLIALVTNVMSLNFSSGLPPRCA